MSNPLDILCRTWYYLIVVLNNTTYDKLSIVYPENSCSHIHNGGDLSELVSAVGVGAKGCEKMFYDLFLQVYSDLKEILPCCFIIFISLHIIYLSFNFLKRLVGYYSFSSPFDDISESKSVYYEIEEVTVPDADKPYKINLSKDKSGGQADLYK